jgi:acyl-CoA synthetase (NDP forming)
MTPTTAPGALHSLFSPRSIALVGASERSAWSNTAHKNLVDFGFTGRILPVNRKGDAVYGRPAATSLRALGEAVDLALLMVPQAAVEDVLDEAREAGIRNAVVLASGYAETGAAGQALQERLRAKALEAGIHLIGPNCVGFVNYVRRTPVFTITPPLPILPGSLANISQSGAVGTLTHQYAHKQGIGLSHIVTTGNEAVIDVGRVIWHMADDPDTRSIAVFIEAVRDVASFRAGAERARAAGKPVVVLKIGRSAATAKSAQAHTGALVGDDRVFDAVCQSLNILRVDSIEEMVVTAELIARTGVLRGDGVGFSSISGGICEILGDRAESVGIRLPEPSPATVQRLQAALPDFGTPHNPLDTTGAIILDPKLMGETTRILLEEPRFDLLGVAFDVPISQQQERSYSRPGLEAIQQACDAGGIPALILSHTAQSLTDHARGTVEALGLNYFPCGLELAVPAIGRAVAWSRAMRETQARPAAAAAPQPAAPAERPEGERALLQALGRCGVPVIPQALARNAQEAATAAAACGCPVAIKIASPDIAHKTEVGGVALNIATPEAAAAACDAMLAAVARQAPGARIDGVVVSPMRAPGVELLVGVRSDPLWGPVLALGLGGVWVEILKDTQLRLLPATEDDVLDMLGRLKGRALLDGYRGTPAVDRRAVARAVVAIAQAAQALGPQLDTLEINPLRAGPDGAEALDALAVWKDRPGLSKK